MQRTGDSICSVFFSSAIVLGVPVLALHDRLHGRAGLMARFATAIGLLWSIALVASGMVFTYGMTTVATLADTSLAEAATAWQAIETVAQGLGGAGGEILGGLWVLLVSWVALRQGALPRPLGWLEASHFS